MTDFVIDASALFELIVGQDTASDLRRSALTGGGSAPELIDLEFLSTLRRLRRSGGLSAQDADVAAAGLLSAPIARTPHRPLLARVGELRDAITPYAAAYVALAETLGVPLLTCDARLGRAHGHAAEVVVYPRS